MKVSAGYVKLVEWNEEDQCYVGSAPGLVLGSCHGDDEKRYSMNFVRQLRRPYEFIRKTGNLYLRLLPVVILQIYCRMSRSPISNLQLGSDVSYSTILIQSPGSGLPLG